MSRFWDVIANTSAPARITPFDLILRIGAQTLGIGPIPLEYLETQVTPANATKSVNESHSSQSR